MPNEDYLRFNVDSVEELLIQKLSEQFPDVSFRGSSANILSEAIASVFSLLIYQINRSAANSSFGKTNSISSLLSHTKLLGYNPVGHQSGSMFVDVSVSQNLEQTSYTIPRYSFINTPVGRFSIDEDQTFINNVTPDLDVIDNLIVRGGSWIEHPLLYSDGTDNQKFILSNGSNIVDHNSIHIYAREPSGLWSRFTQVDSLFLSDGNDRHFEARYNDRGTYDIYFGDGINGKLLPNDSEIAIYYLSVENITDTLTTAGVETNMSRFATDRINSIILDTADSSQSIYLNTLDNLIRVVNSSTNTLKSDPETVEEIRRNAPAVFQTQNRLVTNQDYQSFINNNYSDFVSDALVIDNTEYLEKYIRYYYELGLNQPFLESRALFNQINFSDSCNFNNVYIFLIPKTGEYLSDVQKQLVIEGVSKLKTLSSQIIPSDPIYLGFGLATPINSVDVEDLDNSTLEVTRINNTSRSSDDIRNDVYNTIVNYFDERNTNFDSSVVISELNSLLLNIEGVASIRTANVTTSDGLDIESSERITTEGIQFYEFNPEFPDQVTVAPLNSQFTGIFVPLLVDNNLLNRITIL